MFRRLFFFGELSVDAECFSISDACRSFIAMEEKVIYVSRMIVAFDFNCTATRGQSNLEAMPKDCVTGKIVTTAQATLRLKQAQLHFWVSIQLKAKQILVSLTRYEN